MKLTADFETTTDPKDCRVWAWAASVIGDPDLFYYGNSIDGFMEFVEKDLKNPVIYFHNAKFDFQFILSWLFNQGFTHIGDKKDRTDRTFSTLITDTGQYYCLDVWFKGGKYPRKVRFQDSLKILNFSVEVIAKNFNLPIKKLTLDYQAYRAKGHQLTKEEIDYIRNDVEIMSRALQIMFERDLTKMTIGSDALNEFKKLCPDFKAFFPVLEFEIDRVIRKSYKGGFTYLSPKYQEKETGSGVVFDKNSMYPAKLMYELLPVGEPVPFIGRYRSDPDFPLFMQTLTCKFTLKPNKIPSIQIKKSIYFKSNEYLESSNGDLVTLSLTKPDLELFLENYEVTDLVYEGGFKFHGVKGLFDDYINYWTEQKIESKKSGNYAMYQISKLMLNSLYGKFGLNPIAAQKFPYLGDDGVVHYQVQPLENRDPIYVAVAAFVTAYARADIIRSSQAIRDFTLDKYGFDGYIYSDTDSIHCLINEADVEELSQVMDIDDYRLGAWKLESKFKRGKYLRQKCYIEQDYDDQIQVTVAGFPKRLAPLVTFENFKIGFSTLDFDPELVKSLGSKLSYDYVKGGVILKDTDFTIT